MKRLGLLTIVFGLVGLGLTACGGGGGGANNAVQPCSNYQSLGWGYAGPNAFRDPANPANIVQCTPSSQYWGAGYGGGYGAYGAGGYGGGYGGGACYNQNFIQPPPDGVGACALKGPGWSAISLPCGVACIGPAFSQQYIPSYAQPAYYAGATPVYQTCLPPYCGYGAGFYGPGVSAAVNLPGLSIGVGFRY